MTNEQSWTIGYESIGRSAMRHPFLIALFTVLGLVAGSAIGYEHPVTYTAQAQLLVGRTSGLAEQEVPGLATAVQGLASDYARLATNSSVVSATNAILHTDKLPGTLSASPVPQSSVITVQGQASSEVGAVALANAGAAALVKVVTQATNDTKQQLATILNQYKAAEHDANVDLANVNILQAQLNALTGRIGTNVPTAAESAQESSLASQIAAEQTAAGASQLQAQAFQNDYQNAEPPLQIQQEMVQQVGNATYTSNSRKSYLEAAGLAGFVGGLVIGLGVSAFVDSRRYRLATRRARALTPEL